MQVVGGWDGHVAERQGSGVCVTFIGAGFASTLSAPGIAGDVDSIKTSKPPHRRIVALSKVQTFPQYQTWLRFRCQAPIQQVDLERPQKQVPTAFSVMIYTLTNPIFSALTAGNTSRTPRRQPSTQVSTIMQDFTNRASVECKMEKMDYEKAAFNYNFFSYRDSCFRDMSKELVMSLPRYSIPLLSDSLGYAFRVTAHGLVGALLGVRSMRGHMDMEIVENYQGKQAVHRGKVELFFRETWFAKYNVLKTAQARLDELDVAYSYDPDASCCGGEGQIFLEATAFATLVELSKK
jgi:hypothetical protein